MKSYKISKKEADSSRANAEKQLIEAAEILKKYGLKDEHIIELVKKSKEGIPVTIFANDELSALETIVKFLKENKELSFSRIASLLNRDQRTIWTTYSKARVKKKEKCIEKYSEYYIPFEIFRDRNLGVLENICLYLKDVYKFSFHQIAILLRRDDRTIWTSYNKAREKTKR